MTPDSWRAPAADASRPPARRPFKGVFPALVLIAWCVIVPAQPEVAAGGGLHSVGQSFSVKQGGRVVVSNPYGNVRIRAVPLAATPELRVIMQTEPEVARPAELRVESLEDGVRLSIDAIAEGRLSEQQGFLRADFVIALPDRFALEVEMIDGSFTMHPASYPLRLRARDARVNLRTTGALDVELLAGRVVVQQGGGSEPISGGRIQTSRAAVDVLGADLARVNYATLSGAAVTTDSAALLESRVHDGRGYRFVGDPNNPVLSIQTDEAPIRLVVEGIR